MAAGARVGHAAHTSHSPIQLFTVLSEFAFRAPVAGYKYLILHLILPGQELTLAQKYKTGIFYSADRNITVLAEVALSAL